MQTNFDRIVEQFTTEDLARWMSNDDMRDFLTSEGVETEEDEVEAEEEREEEARLQELRDECPKCFDTDVEGDDAEMECFDCGHTWSVE